MLLRVGADFYRCCGNGIGDLREDLSNASGSATCAGFPELLKILCRGPARASIERQRHTVLGQVGSGGYKIVDGSQSRFAQNIVIDDPEILQVRIAIAERAVKCDQCKELFQI